MHEFGYGGEDGHLPDDGAPPLSLDADVEVSLLVLTDGELSGVETEATQEDIDKPIGQEGEGTGHKGALLIGDGKLGKVLQLLAQQEVETLGIAGAVAVEEGILGLGPRILLQDVVHAGEGVEVVVGKVVDYLLHGGFVFARFYF